MKSMVLAAIALCVACGTSAGNQPAPPPACDQACMDGVALYALRAAVKTAYNVALQGKPVGAQDQTVPCLGGTVHVFGTATSNAQQGTTSVTLTYAFAQCHYPNTEVEAKAAQKFDMSLDGTITEAGVLSAQPTSTTSLQLQSASVTFTGTVYDPPIDYAESTCSVTLQQDGNDLSGTMCGRTAGTTL